MPPGERVTPKDRGARQPGVERTGFLRWRLYGQPERALGSCVGIMPCVAKANARLYVLKV
jgi:hypothetical protein